MAIRARFVGALAGLALAGAAIGVGLSAVPASAAQSTQQLSCNGTTVTIRTNNNNSSQNGGWGAAQFVGMSGHLIPTSFSGSAVDTTAGDLVLFSFSQAKGGGHANHNQPAVSCSQTQTMTLADLIAQNGPPPGGQLPPGTALTDTVTVTFTVTAVQKG